MLAALVACGAFAKAEAAAPECKLTGIVWQENQKQALLEFRGESPSGQGFIRAMSLGEGVREGDGGFEVTTIDERSATVTLRFSGQSA